MSAQQLLFVTHAFPPESWAGVEVYALELALELCRLGHKVTVFTHSFAGPAEGSLTCEQYQGLRVYRWSRPQTPTTLRQSFQDERAEAALREVLAACSPDLVHFHHFLHLSAGLVEVAKQDGLPCVITCHDYWALCARVQLLRPDGTRCSQNRGLGCFACVQNWGQIERAERWLPRLAPLVHGLARLNQAVGGLSVKIGRWAKAFQAFEERHEYVTGMYARADLLICPSRFLQAQLAASGRFRPEQLHYCDYGSRLCQAEERKERAATGRLRFGFVGTLVWHKGVQVLIEALRLLSDARASVHIFGRYEPERDAFHARLREAARGLALDFRGGLPNDRIAQAYREIDVLVVPSIWYENSPITIHEALDRRTPLLVSGIGGMAELVQDGSSGLHFEVGNASDLANKMRRLLDEPELLAHLQSYKAELKSMAVNAREVEKLQAELLQEKVAKLS